MKYTCTSETVCQHNSSDTTQQNFSDSEHPDVTQICQFLIDYVNPINKYYNLIFLAFIIYPHATAMEENSVHFSMKGISI